MSTADQTRISASGAKCLRVLFALSGHSLTGLSNSELSKALNESPATINRCLNTLIAEGAAIKLDSGRFAPSIRVLQMATRHAQEFSKARARMDEIDQRLMAGANL
ncbi:winged helix-turn-helix transcriptional regulator [Marinobacterium litorale]|uniref:winged helix-turn-helix transcriptional regulator n=1 Tax=Marinobacterium litorale TaxID=404770 RepID=UPI00042749EC|nr:helix-turn-helix domain-containing protein [Marinobacterium litorale]